MSILQGTLAMIKSFYNQPDIINKSLLFDKINAERIYFQFCSALELSIVFSSYLFSLS